MKRFWILLILLCLCVSMTGCKVLDYTKATGLYEKGEYTQALALYQSLGDYADSESMALLCSQKANYAEAGRLYVNGRYEQALTLYEGLGMYADSPVKVLACRYELGVQSLAEKDYEQAIAWLAPLGSYEDSGEKVAQARWEWLLQNEYTHVIEETAESYRAMALGPAEDGRLYLYLVNGGVLMGITYELEYYLLLEEGRPEAEYWIRYASRGESDIENIAGGTVSLETFRSGGAVEIGHFQQWIDADEQSEYSQDPGDSMVIRSVLADAQTQILTYLPDLLEETGVEISPADLGL